MTARVSTPAGKARRVLPAGKGCAPLSRDNELIRQAEIRLRGHANERDCYTRLLTAEQYRAVLRLSRASVAHCHERERRGLRSSKTFVYQGKKYWLWYTSFGRVIVARSRNGERFVSSGFGAFGGMF